MQNYKKHTAKYQHERTMNTNKPQNHEAAETVQTTSVPAVDLPRLVLPFELALTRWSVVCIIAFVLVSADPVKINGVELPPHG